MPWSVGFWSNAARPECCHNGGRESIGSEEMCYARRFTPKRPCHVERKEEQRDE